MRSLNKFFQSIFRTSVISLIITFSPFGNPIDSVLASSQCLKGSSNNSSASGNKLKVLESTIMVYVTKTGECYHKNSSACLSHTKIKIPVNEAISNNYRRCYKCFG